MIRPATAVDVPGIAVLWNAMIRDTTATFTTEEKTEAALDEMIAGRKGSFLIHGQGTVEGFVTWGPFRAGPGYARTVEHSIIVGPRGQGIGRALLSQAMVAAARQGHHVMVAAISGENPAAQAFHRRLGFADAGRLAGVGYKAGRWLDLVLMTKLLDTP